MAEKLEQFEIDRIIEKVNRRRERRFMDKAVFRSTEKKLYNYFSKDKNINSRKRKIQLLNSQIEQIEYKLRNVNVTIPIESRSAGFDERVQSSSDGSSYAEKALIRITDNLLNEQVRKAEEINMLEEEIRNIEADNIIIEFNIKDLNENDIEFLKLKYQKCLSDKQVAYKLNMDQSTATRKRQKLVEDIARWENWLQRVL